MKRDEIEQLILLEQSGELSSSQQRQLQKALDASEEARAWRDELHELLDMSKSAAATDADVSPHVLEIIKDEARKAVSKSEEIVLKPTPRSWIPKFAFAAAGLALILTAAWMVVVGPSLNGVQVAQDQPGTERAALEDLAWEDDFDQELQEIENLFAMSTDNGEAMELDDDDIANELLKILEGESI